MIDARYVTRFMEINYYFLLCFFFWFQTLLVKMLSLIHKRKKPCAKQLTKQLLFANITIFNNGFIYLKNKLSKQQTLQEFNYC